MHRAGVIDAGGLIWHNEAQGLHVLGIVQEDVGDASDDARGELEVIHDLDLAVAVCLEGLAFIEVGIGSDISVRERMEWIGRRRR